MRLARFLPLAVLCLLFGCARAAGIADPLPHTGSRPTPLHFGVHVTDDPAKNPINPPERFTGYHAAVDFEILKNEKGEEVPVYAICDGTVAFSGHADGYGGVVLQWCELEGQQVTVIYGHVAMEGLPKEGEEIHAGQEIAELGAGRSADTDGSRKHLHLGILKGRTREMRGYVESPAELKEYIDPMTILGRRATSKEFTVIE